MENSLYIIRNNDYEWNLKFESTLQYRVQYIDLRSRSLFVISQLTYLQITKSLEMRFMNYFVVEVFQIYFWEHFPLNLLLKRTICCLVSFYKQLFYYTHLSCRE